MSGSPAAGDYGPKVRIEDHHTLILTSYERGCLGKPVIALVRRVQDNAIEIILRQSGSVPYACPADREGPFSEYVTEYPLTDDLDLSGVTSAIVTPWVGDPVRVRIQGSSHPDGVGGAAGGSLPIGETRQLRLFVHCGLHYARIDGRTWETTPMGDGGAPRGWPGLVTGTASRTAEDIVVFTSSGVVDRLVFRPTTEPMPACF